MPFVRLPAHVFAGRVIHRLVFESLQRRVGRDVSLTCPYRRQQSGSPAPSLSPAARASSCLGPAWCPGGGWRGPAPGVELLAGVLVTLLAAEIDLVDLHEAEEQVRGSREGGVRAIAEVPGRLLCTARLAAQLHERDAFDAGGQQVDGQRLGAVAELRLGHDRVGAHGEALAAAAAAVGHAGWVYEDCTLDQWQCGQTRPAGQRTVANQRSTDS